MAKSHFAAINEVLEELLDSANAGLNEKVSKYQRVQYHDGYQYYEFDLSKDIDFDEFGNEFFAKRSTDFDDIKKEPTESEPLTEEDWRNKQKFIFDTMKQFELIESETCKTP